MEYLVNISKKARILKLKRRNMKKTNSDNQYAVSIKEDTAYLCLHFTKDHEGNKINTSYPENPIRRIQVIECEDYGRYRTWLEECWKRTWDDVPVVPLDGGKKGCSFRLNLASIYRFLMVYGVTDSSGYAVTLLMTLWRNLFVRLRRNHDVASLWRNLFVRLQRNSSKIVVISFLWLVSCDPALTQNTKVVDITFLYPWPLESTSKELV
ncbi:hypothetical protein Tco_0150995 [Tanacetum coccineum]